MALVACPALYVPAPNYFAGTPGLAFSTTLLDAAADRVAGIFSPPKTGNLLKIEVRIGTVPVLTTSSLTVGIQTVDPATGDPDGTFLASGTIATGSITANTTVKVTLGAALAVTRSPAQALAVVVQFGTFAAGDQVNINGRYSGSTNTALNYFGYPDTNTTGAYVKGQQGTSAFSLEYDDGSYAYTSRMFPVLVAGTVTYNNTSTPDEIGLRFQLTGPCKLGGCVLGMDADGAFNVVLYTAAGRTVVAAVDPDIRSTTGAGTGPVMFTAEQTLAANTTYVLAVEPSSATSVILSFHDASTAPVLDQYGTGQGFHYATAKDPATTADFTMTTTRQPVIGLILTAIDDGASGSGSGLIRLRP